MMPSTPVRKTPLRHGKIAPSPLAPRKRPVMKSTSNIDISLPTVQPVELGTLFYTAGDETERFQIDFERELTISGSQKHHHHHHHNHNSNIDTQVETIDHNHYNTMRMPLPTAPCRSPMKQWRSSRNVRQDEMRSPPYHHGMKRHKKLPCSV